MRHQQADSAAKLTLCEQSYVAKLLLVVRCFGDRVRAREAKLAGPLLIGLGTSESRGLDKLKVLHHLWSKRPGLHRRYSV
jgi:hypothetical protein